MNYIEGLNKFFSDPIWDVISNLFTFLGILGVGITIFRFIHNKRKRHWHSNIEIHDYSYNYDPEEKEYNAIYSKIWDDTPSEYMVTIVFKPIDCIIPKLKVMSIDETTGKSANTIEIFTDLTPNDAVCFRLERAECIPRVKLRWFRILENIANMIFQKICAMELTMLTVQNTIRLLFPLLDKHLVFGKYKIEKR